MYNESITVGRELLMANGSKYQDRRAKILPQQSILALFFKITIRAQLGKCIYI